jgi:methylmalonyl-CoA mutase N-terminal domain/subunit
VIAAIEKSFFQQEIAEAAFRFQSEVDRGERVIVGVNRFVEEEPVEEPALLQVAPALEREQVERVRALRARRDPQAVEAALARLKLDAAGEANLMPAIIEAAKAKVTMGEMCDVLRDVFGVWRETPVF